MYNKLWAHVGRAHKLAQLDPALLVKVMRIVENDHVTNRSLEEHFGFDEALNARREMPVEELERESVMPPQMVRNPRARSTRETFAIEEEKKDSEARNKCRAVLNQSISVRAVNAFSKAEDIDSVLEAAEELINELPFVQDRVAPCFPPHYDVFGLYL